MPRSAGSSDNGSSNATDDEEVVLFECRICKQQCTAAEKDSHRAMHKRKRARSPSGSEVPTLFQPVTVPSPDIPKSAEMEKRAALLTATAANAKKKAETRAKSGKRRAKKNYYKDVKWVKSPGS